MKQRLRSALCAAAITALVVPTSAGQEVPPPAAETLAKVEACLAASDAQQTDPYDCVGLIFEVCDGSGGTTLGMARCLAQERDYWSGQQVQLLSALKATFDAANRQNMAGVPVSVSLAKSQSAWEAYRDAQCRFEYDLDGAGSMRVLTGGICLRDQAAERALYLRSLNAEFQQ